MLQNVSSNTKDALNKNRILFEKLRYLKHTTYVTVVDGTL